MKKSILLVLFISLCLTLTAQTKTKQYSPALTEASPESVGMSSERLGRIDDMCTKAVSDGHLPGIVALVARKGKIVFHRAYGSADAATGRTLTNTDIFRIASQSKAITSTAIMMLWEEGYFQLDDPISGYIPEFKDPQVLKGFTYRDTSYTTEPADKEITIRHLLTHTSGIGYGIIDGDERMRMIYHKAGITDLFTEKPITIGESVRKLAKLPLHHNPGEKFTYSEGLDVLGYLIEVVTGMTFAEFLQERLFGPLGMEDTGFYLPDSKADRLVRIQHKKEGEWANFPYTFYDPDYPIVGAKKFYSGGAGLSSTAKDYATFLQMYLNNGEYMGKRFLSRTTLKAIMGDQVDGIWGNEGSDHGLAFGLVNEKGEDMGGQGSEGTFTWGGYFNTQYFADPEEQVIGVLMKQTQGPVNDQTGWKFKTMVMAAVDD